VRPSARRGDESSGASCSCASGPRSSPTRSNSAPTSYGAEGRHRPWYVRLCNDRRPMADGRYLLALAVKRMVLYHKQQLATWLRSAEEQSER
jgi:hypothetical protein